MKTLVKKVVLGTALVASTIAATAPAEAQYYRRHRGGDTTGAAILGGIVGLGVGAAIASSSRNRYNDRGYYNDGYYYNQRPRVVYQERYYAPPPRVIYRDRYDRGYRRGYYGGGYGGGYGGYNGGYYGY